MTTPHPHAEVIKAWADDTSLVVQCREEGEDEWFDIAYPSKSSWDYAYEYRIKPVPKSIGWTNVYRGGVTGVRNASRFEADNQTLVRYAEGQRIAVLEVRDDHTCHFPFDV